MSNLHHSVRLSRTDILAHYTSTIGNGKIILYKFSLPTSHGKTLVAVVAIMPDEPFVLLMFEIVKKIHDVFGFFVSFVPL